MKTTTKITITTIAIFTLLVSACGGNMDQMANDILYPFADVNKKYPVPDVAPDDLQEVWLEAQADDGSINKIHAWTYQAANPTARVFVYLHGNGENLQALHVSKFLAKMKELKSHFIVIDYPSLGKSTGTPNEYNLVSAAMAAIDWADNMHPNSALVVWGRSLGAAVAAQAAKYNQSKLQGLILTNPWNRFIDVAKEKTGLADNISQEWLAKNSYETDLAAREIFLFSLIHHGVKDTVIPIKFGRIVYSNFFDKDSVQFVELPDKEHNDIFTSLTSWQDVHGFIR